MDAALCHTKLTALQDELDTIHLANKSYWDRAEHTRQATAEYQRRQERLEQIRKEMQELEKSVSRLRFPASARKHVWIAASAACPKRSRRVQRAQRAARPLLPQRQPAQNPLLLRNQ